MNQENLTILRNSAAHYIFNGLDCKKMLSAINLSLDNEIYLDEFEPVLAIILDKSDQRDINYYFYSEQIKTAFLALINHCAIELPSLHAAFKTLLLETAYEVIKFPDNAESYAADVIEMAKKHWNYTDAALKEDAFYKACFDCYTLVIAYYSEEEARNLVVAAAKKYVKWSQEVKS
jgi:hypothetical protein